jgi:hypothetical protein
MECHIWGYLSAYREYLEMARTVNRGPRRVQINGLPISTKKHLTIESWGCNFFTTHIGISTTDYITAKACWLGLMNNAGEDLERLAT